MRKFLMKMVLTLCIAVASLAVPSKAQARCYGCWAGAAVAAGVIGSAIIADRAYGYGYYGGYAPAYGYGYAPYSYAPYGYGYASLPGLLWRILFAAPHYHRGYYAPRRAYARHHYDIIDNSEN